jgi:hypothetical protein
MAIPPEKNYRTLLAMTFRSYHQKSTHHAESLKRNNNAPQ